jgi:tape measure domain-containing protein
MFGNGNISIKINGDASNFERAVNKSIGLSKSFAGAIGVAFSATAAIAITKQLIEISDRYTQLDGRLRLVTKSTADFQAAQAGLYKIAQDTRVEYEATADLYTRIARSTDNLGLSQKDLLGITESINKALIVSGASGESASAALMQLGQGMASGALRGEELNSVMEQTPRLAQMIADGLGVGIGQLREMGKEGKITSEVLIGALQRGAASVNDEFSRMPETVGQAMTKMSNAFENIVSGGNDAAGATNGIADAINNITTTLETNREGIISGIKAIGDAAAYSLEKFGQIGKWINDNPSAASALGFTAAGAAVGGKFGGAPGAAIGGTVAGAIAVGRDERFMTPAWRDLIASIDAQNSAGTPQAIADENAGIYSAWSADASRGSSGSGTKKKGSVSVGSDDGSKKRNELIEKLRESLMTETELENKRYEDGLALIEDYYGARTELTTEDDEMRLKLAEDHAAKMDEIAGVTKWDADLEAMQKSFETEAELEQERYDLQLERLQAFLEAKAITEDEYLSRKLAAEEAHSKVSQKIAQDEARAKLGAAQNFFSMLATMQTGQSKALIAVQKAAAIISATISARESVVDAFKWGNKIGGPALGFTFAGIAAAAQAANIAAIASADSGGSVSTSSYGTATTTSSDGTTSAETTTSNRTVTIYGLNSSDLYTGEQVAELLNEYLADGGKLQIM